MDFLSHFLGCSEKVRTLRREILATPALPDPVQHSRTGNCFPDALSLYSLLTIVLYCIPFSQLYHGLNRQCSMSNFPPPPSHCSPQWPAQVRELRLFPLPALDNRSPFLLHIITCIQAHMWSKVRKWEWDSFDYPCPCFRTPTARRWRSGRRTTPSSRMSTTCATPRWPSGWRMSRRYNIFILDPSLMIVDPWHCLTNGLGWGWRKCKF